MPSSPRRAARYRPRCGQRPGAGHGTVSAGAGLGAAVGQRQPPPAERTRYREASGAARAARARPRLWARSRCGTAGRAQLPAGARPHTVPAAAGESPGGARGAMATEIRGCGGCLETPGDPRCVTAPAARGAVQKRDTPLSRGPAAFWSRISQSPLRYFEKLAYVC